MPGVQRRAGEYDGPPAREIFGDGAAHRAEPGPPVVVRERKAAMHLLDVGGRMHVVGVEEGPPETLGERAADRRLAGPGNAHDDDDPRVPRVRHSSRAWSTTRV